jgi:hypothetical protein
MTFFGNSFENQGVIRVATRIPILCLIVGFTFCVGVASAAEQPEDEFTIRSRKNLKQIALAFHNYHATYDKLPGFANFDSNRKPLLSWRVHLLPYIGDDAEKLYSEFHLNEPWSSEQNKKLIMRIPQIYSVPLDKPLKVGHTCYVVPRSVLTLFPQNENNNTWQLSFGEIHEGLGNIILTVEADHEAPVPWTKPADLQFDRSKPLSKLGHLREGGFLVSWASGKISFIPNSLAADRADRTDFLRGLFERTGRGLAYYLNLK